MPSLQDIKEFLCLTVAMQYFHTTTQLLGRLLNHEEPRLIESVYKLYHYILKDEVANC